MDCSSHKTLIEREYRAAMPHRANEHISIISVKTQVMCHFERPLKFNIRKAERNLLI